MSATVSRSPRQEAWRRFRRDRVAVFFLVVFVGYLVAAVLAQGVELVQGAPFTYEQSLAELGFDVPEAAIPPSAEHPLAWWGTTSAGKSVLLRVFHGVKVAFVVGTFGAGLAVLIGMSLGLLAGYAGRWIDEAVVYVYSTVASIPYLLLMLALAFIVRQGPIAEVYRSYAFAEYVSLGLFNIVLVVGLTSWVTLCRLVRAEVKKVRQLEYV